MSYLRPRVVTLTIAELSSASLNGFLDVMPIDDGGDVTCVCQCQCQCQCQHQPQ